MNEQYATLVGKVCAPRYEEVYTPEVKSKLPIEASSEGRNLKDYIIYGNNNPNHVDESQSTLPVNIDTYGGNAIGWEIFGNNNPVVENKTSTLPIDASATAGNLLDYTIYGNNDIGKNVIQLGESQTINGVTITIDRQAGTAILSGDTTTAEGGFSVALLDTSSLVGGDYIFSGGADGGSSTKYDLYLYNRTDQVIIGRLYSSSDTITATIENGKRYMVYVQYRKGQVYDNIVFKPMLRPANTTSAFEPYTVGVGERTKNLYHLPNDATFSGVTFTGDSTDGTVTANGTNTGTQSGSLFYERANYPDGDYYLSGCADGGSTATYNIHIYDTTTSNRAVSWDETTISDRCYSSSQQIPVHLYSSHTYRITIQIASGYTVDNIVFKPMLRKADATSDFIPYGYQIPMQAKQRTKNIFEIIPSAQIITETGTLIFATDAERGTITANGTAGSSEASVKQRFTVTSELAGDYYFSGSFNQTGSVSTFDAYMYDNTARAFIRKWDGTTQSPTIKGTESQEVKLIEGHTIELTIRVFATTSVDNLVFKPMIRKADTSSDFEPYYNINQTDIYIGNSPLTQGQSITKAQSGQDITLFSGDNSIDTTLYNKPNVSITYNSNILGVGEPTQNEFEITGNDTYTYRGVTFVRDNINNTIVANGQATGNVFYECGDITLKAGVKYILTGCPAGGSYSPNTYLIYAMGHIDWGYDTGNGLVLPIMTEDTVITPRIGVYTGAGAFTDLVFKPEVKKVGYQIPISVTSRQQSVLHNIYVGENPLTAEQSISKTSTGTDIVLYQGENTISTTLGNKPDMKIDYLSTEVGVGERTKNFIRATVGVTTSGITYTVDSVAGIVTANGTATGSAQLRIAINYPEQLNNNTVPPGNYYFSGCPSDGSGDSYNCYSWDYDAGARSKQWDGTTAVETDRGQGNCQVQISGRPQSIILRITQGYTANNVVFKPMLRRADTTPDFEPYGYQIPIDIKQDNEVVDHKDIYIGTQPLEEGASVSKVSVGEDIALASGNNYIDTDLFNKPEMYIK